jgi:hypothetical protein
MPAFVARHHALLDALVAAAVTLCAIATWSFFLNLLSQ